MTEIVSKPDHGASLIAGGRATNALQSFFDDIAISLNGFLLGTQVQLTVYTVATLPAATRQGGTIYVSDEVGGSVMANSDGTNWRRSTDRAIVS